jgi:hypothetical protein
VGSPDRLVSAEEWSIAACFYRNDPCGTSSPFYELIATADTSGWTFHVPNRKPIPVQITTAGDSMVTSAGPFESALRKGVQVTLHGVLPLEAGRLTGTTVARFGS